MKKGSSIALLIIGLWYIWIMSDFGDVYGSHCAFGDGRFFATFFFIPLYSIILLVSLFISTIRYFAEKRKFNYLPLLTTSLVIIIFYSIDFMEHSTLFESPNVLYAERFDHYPDQNGNITLKQNKRFELYIEDGMAYSILKGKYTLNNDTLILLRDIATTTSGKFSNVYYIDKPHGVINAVINNKIDTNSNSGFTIKSN